MCLWLDRAGAGEEKDVVGEGGGSRMGLMGVWGVHCCSPEGHFINNPRCTNCT